MGAERELFWALGTQWQRDPDSKERAISRERVRRRRGKWDERTEPPGRDKVACTVSWEDPPDSWRNRGPFQGFASSDVAGLQSDRIALGAAPPGLMGATRSLVLSA